MHETVSSIIPHPVMPGQFKIFVYIINVYGLILMSLNLLAYISNGI